MSKHRDISTPIIVALDTASVEQAWQWIKYLTPERHAIKVGKELFLASGADFVRQLVDERFKIFLDLKLHDIPNTVAKACKVAADLGVWMITVHCSGGNTMLKAAYNALSDYNKRPLLIGVTVLTAWDQQDLLAIGINRSLKAQVLYLADQALQCGLDGVVCSAHEAKDIRAQSRQDFILVTPGIRLPTDAIDDQKRIMTPHDALYAGSNYLVIGRSITKASEMQHALAEIEQACAAIC